ncbi:hypothetical protein ACIQMV_13380 [Streptomyces sp. NPDC091412]|uniref:hypothetical protein n=1 Tax=Streptomyces sp. NPDC091412 TaxID=3366002 RepID=UPI0038081E2C
MDQGTAAVWAAAIAGLLSSTSALIVAVAAGHSERATVKQTAVEERGHRHEADRRESYGKYTAKINAACDAFDDMVQTLRDGGSPSGDPASRQVIFRVMREVESSYLSDVYPRGQDHVITAAGLIHDHLVLARDILFLLLAHPEAVQDEQSQGMQQWIRQRLQVRNAHMWYSACVSQAIYAA